MTPRFGGSNPSRSVFFLRLRFNYKMRNVPREDDPSARKDSYETRTPRENAGAAREDGKTGRRIRNGNENGRFVWKTIKWLMSSMERNGVKIN